MIRLTERSPISDLLKHPLGRGICEEYLPMAVAQNMLELGLFPLHMVANFEPGLVGNDARRAAFLAKVTSLEIEPPQREQFVAFRSDYDSAPAASAEWKVATKTPAAWRPVEVELRGPSHGNPFIDVDLHATVTGPAGSTRVTGFYDGDGRYVFRFLPDAAGSWQFVTDSNAQSLSGIAGSVDVGAAPKGAHGPVRVNGFGFKHADGTRHLPLGTTSYVWTHQTPELEEMTLQTLANGPFNKMRMCVFPKSYLFNRNEPRFHAFERNADGSWDTTRFVPEFFRHLEERVSDLDAIGVEADIILFHPYDRWGYADLGEVVDDRYLKYVVARLSAHPNVWWSFANEYDLMASKTMEDWDRFAAVVQANDPVDHLRGVHNCITFFDNSRVWVTHSSMQRVDLYRTAEEVDKWRTQWGKPVVVDECAYEGNIDQGWGNISGEEMTRRFWEAAVRGGWCGHGETYWSEDEVLWWSKGGELKGTSPARIAFLRKILEEAPGDLEPGQSTWDAPTAVVGDSYRLTYFSFMQPLYRNVVMPSGSRWQADVIDTWNMTVTPVSTPIEGAARIDLPGRPFVAIRLRRID